MKKAFLSLLNKPTFRLMFRYGLVGVFASFIHWLTAYWAYERFSLPFLVAHSIGFFAGMLPAYWGHYFYSFNDHQPHKKRFPKFFAVSSFAFIIHESGAFALVAFANLDYSSVVLPLLVVLVPVITFLLNRFWVFSNTETFR